MKTRKRNIFLIQVLLFLLATLLIYFTYYNKENDVLGFLDKKNQENKIIKELGKHPEDKKPVRIMENEYGPYIKYKSLTAKIPEEINPNKITMKEALSLIEKKIDYEKTKIETTEQDNISKFSNVQYKGIDLNGNRYILKSKKAEFAKGKSEIIYMNGVDAVFYFKDGTELYVTSKKGVYNNKTNDIQFKQEVSSKYLDNLITSENLDFFNSKNLLEVYGNVKGTSGKGTILADNLKIDILKKTLDIKNKDNLIDVNIYKWKNRLEL